MKTTIDIQDVLLMRAKRLSQNSGRPLRALVEEGLSLVLDRSDTKATYRMPDCSVGSPDDPNPLEGMSWQDLRLAIYEEADAL